LIDKANFTEREIVILASTAAQVNYWTRLLQALGVPPAGFSDHCDIRQASLCKIYEVAHIHDTQNYYTISKSKMISRQQRGGLGRSAAAD
jgi:hypothetical protein